MEMQHTKKSNQTESSVLHITDAQFQTEVLDSNIPVLVDFWAPWCAPCRMVAPILEELSKDFAGRAKIVKMNVDENNQVAGAMGIRSIPTLALFKNGKVVDGIIGASPKQDLVRMIEKSLD